MEDLVVYQKAREFRKQIYSLTKRLPREEKYNLVIQMRGAAVSLMNSIAEGHGRFHYSGEHAVSANGSGLPSGAFR